MRNNQSGFTLIELLIVVLVISALSAVLVSIIDPTGSQGRARDGVRVNTIKNLSEALESYRQIEGSYPADSDPQNPNSLLRTTYIKDWPQPIADDGTVDEDNWSYLYSNTGAGFVLLSPNSQGGCYKYQTEWRNVKFCPVAACGTTISAASECSEL